MPHVIKEIEFDNNYPKLFGQKHAKLLAVFNDASGELLHTKMQELLRYDTLRDDGRFYFIDKNETYMILFFRGAFGIPFTSIRKSNEENIKKYNDSIGDLFAINIITSPCLTTSSAEGLLFGLEKLKKSL